MAPSEEREDELGRRISAAILGVRARSPFFGTLALFARYVPSREVPTACTDGRDVFYNPEFAASLDRAELEALLLHEVLHAALCHPTRRGQREPVRWNVAADIVVNGIIATELGLTLPPHAIRERSLETRSVEEIYELVSAVERCPTCFSALGADGAAARLADIEAYWRVAREQAQIVSEQMNQGVGAGRKSRLVRDIEAPRLDWRTLLWRFVARTPHDFSGFDRRFIGKRIYLEMLEAETLDVAVAVDTSGSITEAHLATFLGELTGIQRAYPHLALDLYYSDDGFYGPYRMGREDIPPRPVGGGGTSFVPILNELETTATRPHDDRVCVCFTDGHGLFPKTPPSFPILWVVTPGGLDAQRFPFGQVVTLLPSAR
jgi:predicted metal-dependent peptidase